MRVIVYVSELWRRDATVLYGELPCGEITLGSLRVVRMVDKPMKSDALSGIENTIRCGRFDLFRVKVGSKGLAVQRL